MPAENTQHIVMASDDSGQIGRIGQHHGVEEGNGAADRRVMQGDQMPDTHGIGQFVGKPVQLLVVQASGHLIGDLAVEHNHVDASNFCAVVVGLLLVNDLLTQYNLAEGVARIMIAHPQQHRHAKAMQLAQHRIEHLIFCWLTIIDQITRDEQEGRLDFHGADPVEDLAQLVDGILAVDMCIDGCG